MFGSPLSTTAKVHTSSETPMILNGGITCTSCAITTQASEYPIMNADCRYPSCWVLIPNPVCRTISPPQVVLQTLHEMQSSRVEFCPGQLLAWRRRRSTTARKQ